MSQFSANQQKFLQALVANSSINPGVAAAWMVAEEPPGATSGDHGSQDWLNIGNTDSGAYGTTNAAWRDPAAAGKLTAQWLSGQVSIPGFGRASAGIQKVAQIPSTNPQAQIKALQASGWASSGYPDLPGLYSTYKSYGEQLAKGIAGLAPGASTTTPGGTGASAGSSGAGGSSTTVSFDPTDKVHSSQLLYATVWIGAIAAAVYLLYLGLDRSTHGSVSGATHDAARTAALAAA